VTDALESRVSAATMEPAPSPWRRRVGLGVLWLLAALLFAGWFMGTRPASRTKQVLMEGAIRDLGVLDVERKRAALETTFREYRQAVDFGDFLLSGALLCAVAAAAAAPVWAALDERQAARAGTKAAKGAA